MRAERRLRKAGDGFAKPNRTAAEQAYGLAAEVIREVGARLRERA